MQHRLLTVALLGSTLGLAQNQNPVIRIDVNLVQVDAVVTDSQGRHISDLKAGDFTVLQDGKPQTIANFSYVTGLSRPTPAPAPAVRAAAVAAPAPQPVNLKPAEVRRMFAMVVDDLGLSFSSVVHVRDALRKFVDEQMQPGDVAAIIRTSGGLGVFQQFTTDKALLHAAIDRIRYSVGRVGVDSFGPVRPTVDPHVTNLSYSDAETALDQVRTQTLLVGTLGALRYVVDGLRDMPGRKSVVVFSESLDLFDRSADLPVALRSGIDKPALAPQVIDDVHRLVDAANRSSVVIDTIDPRGQVMGVPGADDHPSIYGSKGNMDPIGALSAGRVDETFNSRTGMWMLAEQTGGLFLRNNNFVDQLLTAAVADSEGYYLIGYHPDSDTFDPKTGKAKYHSLEIKLKSPGLHVRTRSGFFGESDSETHAVTRSGHDDLLHALLSPFSSGEVQVRLTALFEQSADGRPFLNALLHIDASKIKFTQQPDGVQKAALEVAAMTFGEKGEPVDRSDHQIGIALTPAEFATTLANGLVCQVKQPLKKPGMYQVRVALRDQDSGELGSASEFTDVPDLSKGRLAMSSILLTEDSAPSESAADPTARAARRVFKPGAPLSYEYAIFNAVANPAGKTDLRAQLKLFRDGRQVYAGPAQAPSLTGQGKHLVAGGQLGLTKAIPAGEYVLQLIVTDQLAPEKYRTSAQSMDFEIRP